MYYVLGYADGELEFMTRKAFMFLSAAEEYAANCNQGYKPFVIEVVTEII